MYYSKCRNIGGIFYLVDFVIEHKIAKLRTAYILVHVHNVIEMPIAKLNFAHILLSPDYDEIAKFSACQYFYLTVYIYFRF